MHTRRGRWIAAGAALAVALVSTAYLGRGGPAPSGGPATAAATAPADWPTGLLPAVAEALGREAPWRPEATPQGAQAANPRHGLAARFDAQGLHLATDAGEIRLALAGFGRDGELQAPGAAEAEVDGARVLYRHGPHLTQWFLNSPLGLEQGFTLEQRPEGRGELRLALSITGDLVPTLDRNELAFADQTGAPRLRYGALAAFDAEGRALPARMALDGERLVLAVNDAGARYPVVVDPLFSVETKLTADDGAEYDGFGTSIALDGDTALIGASGVNDEASAAYVFVRSGGAWTPQGKLTPDNPDWSFGYSVALSGDTALIGAYSVDGNKGAAYVFVRDATGTWNPQATLSAGDGEAQDYFGQSVALDGDTALIGADGANGVLGAAYVFVRDGTGAWNQRQKLTGNAAWGRFGGSVALDGDTALIGAPNVNSQAGAAYVFVRDGTGTWDPQATLTAADGKAWDYFGHSVALDGDTALIGAYGVNDEAGAAYLFVRDEAGVWSEPMKLTAANGVANDDFGTSVALAGGAALIGAPRPYTYTPGTAYLFVRDGTGTWHQQQKLTRDVAGDRFGGSVALAGNTALIGAPGDPAMPDMPTVPSAAYLFDSLVDLALVKQVDTNPVPQGATFTYSLHVTNNDTEADATGVVVTDALPEGVSHMSNDSDCTVDGATVTCALGTIPKRTGPVSVAITVRAEAAPGTLITNTASVSADQPDANLEDNTDSVTTRILNTAPVAGDLAFTTRHGMAYSGTLPAADANGDALTFAIVENGTLGTVEITDAATGAFTYTPHAGERGTDSFTFKVHDGTEASDVATVTVTIHNAAPAAGDLALVAYEGSPVSGTLPAADADGDALAFTLVENGTQGSAVITDAATGAFTYTPHAGASGTDTFTFKASDGAFESNTATVTVTILAKPVAGNAAPVAGDLALTAYPGSPVSGTLSAADADGDALTFAIVENGTLGTAVITDAATGAFTYTPHAEASGTDSFTFKVNDGTEDSNIATVTVTIQPAPNPVPDDGNSNSGGGGGGAFSPLVLLLGLAAVARRRTWQPDVSNCWQTRSRRTVSW